MVNREKLTLLPKEGREIISDENDNFKIIERTIEDTGRWSINYRIIVQRLSDGKFFESFYSEGATEAQDEKPYEWGDAVFSEVFKTQKTITVYE
jgi:hypothetical protein